MLSSPQQEVGADHRQPTRGLSTSWMTPDWKPKVAARDHLLAGCLSFSIFVFLAWITAVFNQHHLRATLSEMVHDWDTAEGKIFIPALLLPAIFFLISGYPYVLSNASVHDHPWGHAFVVLRHFCVNAGLILVAFVPTLAQTDTRARSIEVYIHSFGATLTFGSFLLSELFVLVYHSALGRDEAWWRLRALALMTAGLILCLAHKVLVETDVAAAYSEAWTFRYEMLVGAGLVTQCQLIWYFSDPEDDSRFRQLCFVPIATVPYLGALVIVGSDFCYRANQYALPWAALEAALLALATYGVLLFYDWLRGKFGPKPGTPITSYGAA